MQVSKYHPRDNVTHIVLRSSGEKDYCTLTIHGRVSYSINENGHALTIGTSSKPVVDKVLEPDQPLTE